MDNVVRSICNNLVNNDQSLRRKGFRNVRDLFKKNIYLDDLSLQKLCKGLYYCLWMTDDFILVHKLSLNIIQLYKHIKLPNRKSYNNYTNNEIKFDINELDDRLRFLRCLFESVSREWLYLDKNRVDKILLFTRILVSEILYYMNDLGWDLIALTKLSDVYLHPNVFNQNCMGLWLHFIQIYLNELILNYEHLRNDSNDHKNDDQQKEDNKNNKQEEKDNNSTQDLDDSDNKRLKSTNANVFHELDGVKLLFIIKPFVLMFLNTKDQMVMKTIHMYIFKNLEKLSKITNINVVVHLLDSLYNISDNTEKDNEFEYNKLDSLTSQESYDSTEMEFNNTENNDNNNTDNNKKNNNEENTTNTKDNENNTHNTNKENTNKKINSFKLQYNLVITGNNRKYLRNTLKMYKEYLEQKLTLNEDVHVQHILYSLFTSMKNKKENDIVSNADILVQLDRLDSEDSYYNDNKMMNTHYEDGDTNVDVDIDDDNNNTDNKEDNGNINNNNTENTNKENQKQIKEKEDNEHYYNKYNIKYNNNNNGDVDYEAMWNDYNNVSKVFEHMPGKDEIVLKKEHEEKQQLMEGDYINLSNVCLQRISKQRMRNLCILNNAKNYLILVKANDTNSINFMKKLKEPRIQNQLFYYSLIRLRRLRLMYKFKQYQLNKIYDFNKKIKPNFTINLQQALDNIKNIKPTKSSLINHDKSITEGETSSKKNKKVVFNLKKNQVTNIPCRKKKTCNPLVLFNLM